MSVHKIVSVTEEELKEWNELFNDHKNWGIRTELQAFNGVARMTLNRILLTGSAFEETIKDIRAFVANYKAQYA